ncbi:fos-related antigen 2-like isoform X2 [Dreissena polymorpha]|uniref:fos-related antigen 2-like isoform X2 n=1 Tax=Dreissena polymorpha TaxID=45954 RepID=UPI002263C464|nr:fos-related antigen 2-like isoform X2 [Dreissena polymorpha]
MLWNTMSDRLSTEMHESIVSIDPHLNPRVKQEVKSHVLSSRRKRGLSDIDIQEKMPKVEQELTPYELDKKERRKAQNRRAAEKCRKKKQKENQEMAKCYDEEVIKNKMLQDENQRLRQEKEMLQKILEEHQFMCQRAISPSPNNTPGFENKTNFDFTFVSCATGYPAPCQSGIPRETTTPFQMEEEPDVFQGNDFYPTTIFADQIKSEVDCNAPSCAVANLSSLPDLGDLDFMGILNPVSPEEICQYGRQSISDFQDM